MKKTKSFGTHPHHKPKGLQWAITAILLLYSLIAIFLIGNTILSSFKTKSDLISNMVGIPEKFTMQNYHTVLMEEHFGRYFLNSVVLVSVSLLCLIAVASMTAYGLVQYEFKGRGFLQAYFLVGLMFPIQLGILPIFIMMTKLHLNNTLPGMILIYTANLSFSVFVFSNFFKGIPISLIESARIDGGSEFRIFLSIVLPISKPVISTVGLLSFVQLWNDFFMPLVFLTKKNVRTLTLAVYNYTADFLANWDKIFAAVTVALIPIILVYILFSEQIVAGLTGGAVKE